MTDVHYHDYLQLDKILSAQHPESDKCNASAHDEMLFIIIHQTYELWFKQLHYEVDSLLAIMRKPSLNDNSPELQTVVHRLDRMDGRCAESGGDQESRKDRGAQHAQTTTSAARTSPGHELSP